MKNIVFCYIPNDTTKLGSLIYDVLSIRDKLFLLDWESNINKEDLGIARSKLYSAEIISAQQKKVIAAKDRWVLSEHK